jgi:hypothetical protein
MERRNDEIILQGPAEIGPVLSSLLGHPLAQAELDIAEWAITLAEAREAHNALWEKADAKGVNDEQFMRTMALTDLLGYYIIAKPPKQVVEGLVPENIPEQPVTASFISEEQALPTA